MFGPLLVRDRANFRKPMQLFAFDGAIPPLPAEGALFYCLDPATATHFDSREAAEAAIARTVEYGAVCGFDWPADSYEIQYVIDADAERQARRRRLAAVAAAKGAA